MSLIDHAPTRREIIARTSVLVLSSAAGTCALPGNAASTSTIEAAYAEYVRLAKIADAIGDARYEISSNYEEPPRPPYHHFSSQGGHIEFINADRTRGCSYCRVDDENVEYLKAMIAKPFDPSAREPESVDYSRYIFNQTIKQAKETLERVEAWRIIRDREKAAIGLDRAEEAEDDAVEAAQAQIELVLGLTATTLREFALQILVAEDKHEEGRQATIALTVQLPNLVGLKAYYALQQEAA